MPSQQNMLKFSKITLEQRPETCSSNVILLIFNSILPAWSLWFIKPNFQTFNIFLQNINEKFFISSK